MSENVLTTCASSEDSERPSHSCSLIRVFVVRMKKLCFPANEQVDLNLRWAHISEGTFYDVAAQLGFYDSPYKASM